MGAKGIKPVQPLPTLPAPAPAERAVPAVAWMTLGIFFLCMIAAWAVFMLVPGIRVGGNPFSTDRAVFLVVNCGTLTGLPSSVGVGDFNPDSNVGPIVSLGLTAVGVLASLIMGGLAAVRALRLPYRDGQVIWSAVTVTLLAGLGGAVVLGIGMTPGTFGPVDAIFQSLCAFGNCGLVIARLNDLAGWRLHVVLLPLAMMGGAGLPVLLEGYDWILNRRPIGRHSATTVVALAAMYLIGMAGFVFFLWPGGPAGAIRGTIGNASALSLDARTFGFPQSLDALSRPGQWWVVLLMVIGAGSAGTAGGVKVTNLLVLGRGFRQSLRGNAPGKMFGIACAWLGCYAVMTVGSWILLLHFEPQIPADRLAFLSVSAVSNVGLATETVSIVGPGLYVLSAAMLLGRLMPMAMLWWMVRWLEGADGAELLVA